MPDPLLHRAALCLRLSDGVNHSPPNRAFYSRSPRKPLDEAQLTSCPGDSMRDEFINETLLFNLGPARDIISEWV